MAALKHLVNAVDEAVPESLSGLRYAYPQLEFHVAHKVMLSPDWRDRKKVAVICGGGSGHEPFAAGFVGTGMLTAAIAGSIFTAPPSIHITHALQCVSKNNKAGIFVIVPNYTGDCLNFGIAIEKARQAGLSIKEVMVGEDCSIPETEQSVAGKRGLSGMIFVIKIAGALAEKGLPLEKVAEGAEGVLKNMATYSVGLTACAIPGQGLMFELEQDELEFGMGIHGEAGYERKKIGTASEVVALMLKRICNALLLVKGDSVAVLINNFGALSKLEQGIVIHETVNQLKNMDVLPVRVYSGSLTTSLNSAGVHITLLKIPKHQQTMFVECLDDATNAPHWPGCAYSIPLSTSPPPYKESEKKKKEKVGVKFDKREERLMKSCLQNSSKALIEKETRLNELDRGCGDGDCGTTLKRLAEGILQSLDNFPLSYPSSTLSEIADIAEERMGGTSGALYCLFLTNAATELTLVEKTTPWPVVWSRIFRSSIQCLERYGKAKAGDRTMLDTMEAACSMYEKSVDILSPDLYDNLIKAAWQGCEATKNMKPRAGRASYVKQARYLQDVDAGAYAVAIWITAIAETVKSFQE